MGVTKKATRRTDAVLAMCFFLLACLAVAAVYHHRYLSTRFFGDPEDATEMPSASVASELADLSVLDAAVNTGVDFIRIGAARVSLEASFMLAPKDASGRLPSRALRDLVASHFAKAHGWLITGLEPPAYSTRSNESQVHEAAVLRDQAPRLVHALEQAREAGRGASLTDAASIVAVLEELLLGETDRLVDAAYRLNGFSDAYKVDMAGLRAVLQSYQLIYEQGEKADLIDVEAHQQKKALRAEVSATWTELVEFVEDALLNYQYESRHRANPFGVRHFSFDEAVRLARGMAAHFGVWQDSDCQLMKTHLSTLDASSSGQVLLKDFHLQPPEAAYQFSESVGYLRQIGALDESPREPQVRIANYLLGSSNCIAAHAHYSVCCLNECDRLWDELGNELQEPVVTPDRILDFVGNLSTSSVDAPRKISQVLVDGMFALANTYRGEVPLHSAAFAGWMHTAFPQECPFPKAVPDIKFLQPIAATASMETCLAQRGTAPARCGRAPSSISHRSLSM